ncbi:protein O-mannosyl-transferase family [Chryseobacterium koreense]
MKNWTFKKWNTVLGWVMFVIAFFTYLSTIEPNFSFWDCGEYISSAVKLEVTHAPGAALFQLVGAVAAMFAFGNGAHYSVVINAMSALFSAFTILFLFWTITHLVRRLFNKDFEEISRSQEIAVLFAGTVGALCFTFSDTFWFSAVEGEVYAMASMFIALLVWLITKWENEYHDSDNERWLILIFFITGLSVGVHMMCMLAIPAVCLMYYARNYTFTWKSFLWANLITLVILSIVFKGIFPLIMTLFGKVEIFAVNGIGLPFHSGTVIAFIILIAVCYFAINFARKSGKGIYQTAVLSAVYMIIGFSCWMVIPIRATANPPMNLNNPDNAIGMLDYYNREQYGDWPTSYGQNYTAYLDANGIQKNEDGSFKTQKTGDVYEKDESTGTYRKVGERFNYVFSKDHVSLFPRMFSEDKDVMQNYISMYGAPDFSFNYSNEDIADNPEAKQLFEELRGKYEDGTIKASDYLKVRPYNLINVQKPSLSQNLDYFFTFQNGYYFVRYLLWNFAGRQNDLEGNMENTKGNWISGFPFIDNAMYGDQSKMPAKYKNESTVAFFLLPLILGLIGFFFQLNRDFGRFYAILSLFVITSVGIIFYTGVKPFEVRERDYAMVGSFYAFAIWIGLGAAAILWFIQEKVKSKPVNLLAGIALCGIPLMMGFQNYNVHDRSNRYAAYDYAYSTLKSLPKNDILFVYGDNDTYPIWGIQETSGLRDDVKVVNFTLLSTPWNIDQVKRRTYNSMPVPSVFEHADYRDGTNDQLYIMDQKDWENVFANLKDAGQPDAEFAEFKKYLTQDSMTLKEAVHFIKHKSPGKDAILKMLYGEDKFEKFNFLPVSKFILPVNKQNALKSGTIEAKDLSKTVDHITISYKARSMFKNNLLLMDILANFDWKRPINFSSGGIYDPENIFFLGEYLQFDGFSYRLVPIHTPEREDGEMGRVDANSLYQTVKNYRWGNFKDLKVHFDETCTQNIVSYRSSASRAAEALALSGQKAKATELLDLVSKEIPVSKYNDPRSLSSIVYGYIVSGQEQKGLQLAEQLKKDIFAEYDYYTGLTNKQQNFVGRAMRTKPVEYSLVVAAVTDAYQKIGQKEKGYDYLVKSLAVIDKRFDHFIKDLQTMGKEKAYKNADKVQLISPFYTYLFDVMEPYDSTYAKEKQAQMTDAMMKATQ